MAERRDQSHSLKYLFKRSSDDFSIACLTFWSLSLFSEHSAQSVPSARETSLQPIGWDEQKIKCSISRASPVISVAGNSRLVNSSRWLTNRSFAKTITMRWMGQQRRATVWLDQFWVPFNCLNSFILHRRLRLRRFQQKQIQAHSNNFHRRTASSPPSQLHNRQQPGRSGSRANRYYDRFEQASDASLVSELSRASEKAQITTWRRQISHPNPPPNRTTRHLHGNVNHSSRVKRGSAT